MTDTTERVFDRIPNTPDLRDWKMADHLGADRPDTATPLDAVDAALAQLKAKRAAKTTIAFAQAVADYLHGGGTPTPPPPPPPGPPTPPPPTPGTVTNWSDKWQLDQGNTGHCVGFGWAQRFNSQESADPDAASFQGYTNADGDKIYYECKVIDGEPGQENGSQVRSGAIAMQNRGKLTAYAFASTVDDVVAWVQTKGPVVIGSDWMSGMDNPDAKGVVHATGSVRGGHCYLCDGYDPATGLFRFQNSWGTGFGVNGYFYMSKADLAKLLAAQGDACGAWEA